MIGFETETIDLDLTQIIPTQALPKEIELNSKFKQIISSVKMIGIIEPPIVTKDSATGKYILLDGHLRIEALKRLGIKKVTCLISTDDESYTYNKYINRLPPIQEHRMIVKAVERGVSEAKIAEALNIDVSTIVRKRNLLEGICPEVVEMLKDKVVPGGIFAILRKIKPLHQIEVVTMMNDAATYSMTYAQLLFAATPNDQLVNPESPKKIKGLNAEEMSRMETQMGNLTKGCNLIEESYSTDVFNLTLAKGYLGSLLNNARIVRYLSQNYPEYLTHFQKITEIGSLKDKFIMP